MKKNSSTLDLLARLGDSLKSSPLASHARAAQTPAPTQSNRVGEKNNNNTSNSAANASVAIKNVAANTSINSNQPQGRGVSKNENISSETKSVPVTLSNSAEEAAYESAVATQAVPSASNLVLTAQNAIKAPLSVQVESAKVYASTTKANFAEVKKVSAAAPAKAQPKKERAQAYIEIDRMIEKMEEMRKILPPEYAEKTVAEYLADKKAGKVQTAPTVVQSNPAAAIAYHTARNPVKNRASWKSATVGLYAADYEKVRQIMDYAQEQTGENLNLSRVIQIALRSLELGPGILEANDEVKRGDRRAQRGAVAE